MNENLTDTALQLIRWINAKAIDGVPPLSSAESLAREYLLDLRYSDDGKRIESLIQWEATKNFTTAFVTGLGGALVMPVSLPAQFGVSWVVQARLSAAIARICGFDLGSERVRTLVVGCLVGDGIAEMLADTGLKAGSGQNRSRFREISGEMLIEMKKNIGAMLLRKAGQKGVEKLARGVPLVGGVVGAAFDAGDCRAAGKNAKALFYTSGETP